ncbi:hydrolase TatD [Nibricoccus aquaticus]|uniref:Hydrolase TatD n=1 Tax=Nibricoccus aquaticus TaxID=2576891 RepID=A0A290Q4N0_9BACT|nr:TatD family hydrolase [Nibricoccus aquaticus]ATC63444.1 hydrolase TatD [Nibricoccus aquaticus]
MSVPLYDAHNHLHDEWLFLHREKISAQLSAIGLRRAVVNGTAESDWLAVLSLARAHPTWITPSLGLHPWHVGNRSANWLATLTAHLDATPHAALGEIGIDRWMTDRAHPSDTRLIGLRRAPLAEQLDAFSAQLSLATARNLPATLHCLDAWGALHDTLRTAPALPARGFLLHAYGGPAELIRRFADLGAYFSFNGYFLDDRRARQLDTFRHIPPDRLLIETDAPAMPIPQAWRTHKLPPSPEGTPLNHPGNIGATYTALAAFLGEPLPSFATRIEQNFLRLFRPARPPS